MTIGERVKSVRENKSLNQREFAKTINVGQSTLAMFETNQREVRDIHIDVICQKYNISENWLRTGEGEMYNIPEDEVAAVVSDLLEGSNPLYDSIVAIMKTYQKLDEKSQAVLDDFIRDVADSMKERG